MSTLWTPRGEHQVPKPGPDDQAKGATTPGAPGASGRSPAPSAGVEDELTPEEVQEAQAEMEAMRRQLLEAPVEVVIANHIMGIWELAALHLSETPPNFAQAQLAIDAVGALVDALEGRLGESGQTLVDALANIRMAFVQIHRAQQAGAGPGGQAHS